MRRDILIYEERISDAILDRVFGIPRVLHRVVTLDEQQPAEVPDEPPMPTAA